jgi:hypothetical protein
MTQFLYLIHCDPPRICFLFLFLYFVFCFCILFLFFVLYLYFSVRSWEFSVQLWAFVWIRVPTCARYASQLESLCTFLCILCTFLCILYVLCGYASQLVCIYASQIRVPNYVPGYASQIDVPIRVPNELFIKVQVGGCAECILCVHVDTRPNFVYVYASQLVCVDTRPRYASQLLCVDTRPNFVYGYASRLSYVCFFVFVLFFFCFFVFVVCIFVFLL